MIGSFVLLRRGDLGRAALWYRLGMVNSSWFSLLFLSLIVACGDDAPLDVCTDYVEPHSVPLFERCNPMAEEQQCLAGVCVEWGFCAEPCEQDDDCIDWGGDATTVCSTPSTPFQEGPPVQVCNYYCGTSEGCPAINGLKLSCPGGLICGLEDNC
jgi:hypothetical protein